MICLIWRQHRWQLLWIGLFLAALCGFAVWVGWHANQSLSSSDAWLKAMREAEATDPLTERLLRDVAPAGSGAAGG